MFFHRRQATPGVYERPGKVGVESTRRVKGCSSRDLLPAFDKRGGVTDFVIQITKTIQSKVEQSDTLYEAGHIELDQARKRKSIVPSRHVIELFHNLW